MTPSLLLGLALTVAAPAPKETPKDPPGKLDGDWVVESIEGPKEGPPGSVTMHFADGKISIKEAKRDKPEDAAYTVDPAKKPAHIDIRPGKGPPGKDMVIQGIYEVAGDTLKLAFTRDGGERPTEFKGDAAKGVMMVTLKRVKADK